jgi:sodium-dependent dicarboxylate transporter 2/3/5
LSRIDHTTVLNQPPPTDNLQKIPLERFWRKWLWIFVALAVLVLILLLPLPPAISTRTGEIALSTSGRACLAIVSLCLILWVSEAIPVAVTSLLIFLLMPAFGVADFAKTLQNGFGNPLILFFLSLFIISTAFEKVGLGHRLCDFILSLAKGKNNLLLALMLYVGALLSILAGGLAATSIMLGTARQILSDIHDPAQRNNFGRKLLIITSWGPLIGSVGTPLGAGSNIITMVFLETLVGYKLTFLNWMVIGVPLVFLLLPFAWFILAKTFPEGNPQNHVPYVVRKTSSITPNERTFLVIFCVTLFLWIAGPGLNQLTAGRLSFLTLEFVGLAAAAIIFLPGINLLTWVEAEQGINIGIVFTVAGGLAGGVLLSQSGAAQWLSTLLLHIQPGMSSIWVILLVLGVIFILRFLFTTSTAAASVCIPLVIAISTNASINPRIMAMAACFTINLSFMFPVQAAVHMMGFSAGHYSSEDMVKSGVWLSLLVIIIIAFAANTLNIIIK